MTKGLVIFILMLMNWITIFTIASNDDWNVRRMIKKRKPYTGWCNCETVIQKPPKPTQPTPPEDDPCAPYNPPTPDFSRPGQRVSTAKCQEYIWQIQVRIKRTEREKQCNNKLDSNETPKNKRNADIGLSQECFSGYNNVQNSTHALKRDVNTDNANTRFEPVEFVVGGRDAKPKEFPHMAAVGWRSSDPNREWKFMCGSSLISPKFALTAAHCTSASPRDDTILDIIPKIVRFGVENIQFLNLDHIPKDRNISKIIPHPDYHSPLKYNDIALFELDRPFTFSKYFQPACLWTEDMSTVKQGTVTGWGVTSQGAHKGYPHLQAATLDVVDSQTCDRLLGPYYNRNWPKLIDSEFCAGQMAGGVDACQGDSGGPFQTTVSLSPEMAEQEGNMHYVVGVTSFGLGCGSQNTPGVYTRVESFLDWIEPIVWSN